jgi:hypothetical protein
MGHLATERPYLLRDSLDVLTLLTNANQFGTLVAQLVRRKLMATITKIKSKYKVQIRRKGYPAITKRFHDLKDARKFARDVESQMERGVFEDYSGARGPGNNAFLTSRSYFACCQKKN